MKWWEAPEWAKPLLMNYSRRDRGPVQVIRVARTKEEREDEPTNAQRPFDRVRVFVGTQCSRS